MRIYAENRCCATCFVFRVGIMCIFGCIKINVMKKKFSKEDWDLKIIDTNLVNRCFINGVGEIQFNGDWETTKANANLIAAAPDLLEACILMKKNGFQTPSNKDFDFLILAIEKALK